MSKRLSSWKSFLWHQRFGYSMPDSPAPVESPVKREPRPVRPMQATARMGHYLDQSGSSEGQYTSSTTVQLMHLTPAQRRRWLKKANQAAGRERHAKDR